MMRLGDWLGALFLCAGLSLPATAAECLMPAPAPPMPKGATASAAEMASAKAVIQDFVNKLQVYQICLETEIKNAPADTTKELKIAWRAQGNAAIDEAQALAADFAAQLKLFKSRASASPAP
jgi:hypothetical protein